jgi:hypothetical protein
VIEKSIIKEIFWLSVIVSVLHYAALTFYFYWTISWFDIAMHLMGGFLMGLIGMFILIKTQKKEIFKNKKVSLMLVLSFVLIIGLGWELWELFVGFTDIISDRLDTMIDLMMDFIGGYFAFLHIDKKLWKEN